MNKNTLYKIALGFLERGWPIFPVGGDDGKKPLVKWGEISATTQEEVRVWLQTLPVTGWGLPTGARSGLVVVDVDGGDVPEWLVPTYTVTTPRGWHFYYKHDGRIKNSVKQLGPHIDVRGDGGYVVLPGSHRPNGAQYQEAGGELAGLPRIVYESHQPSAPALVVLETRTSNEEAYRRAEAYVDRCEPAISGSGGHRQTLLVARALVSGFGLPPGEAEALMLRYGARCQPPWSPAEIQHKVKTAMTTADPKGRRTGYMLDEPDRLTIIDDIDDEVEDLPEVIHAPAPATIDEDAIREDLARQIADIGDIARMYMSWVRESSRIWQPGLAAASALALGATLAGRRWHWRGTTSHLYVLGVGGSGTGKDIAAKALGRVLSDQTMGGIPSTKAWRDRLAECSQGGLGLCLVSGEIAKLLRQLLGPRVPAYLQLGGQMMLELATWGIESMRIDRAVSDQADGQQVVIRAPSFSIYGTATPEDLLDILGEGAVKDGMLGRFLLFRSQDKLPDKDVFLQPKPMPKALAIVIEDRAREINNWISSADSEIYAPDPEAMPGTDGKILAAYDAEIHRARQLGTRGGMPDELVARLAEHATRVAIALAGLSSTPRVTENCEKLAILLVEQSARDLAETSRRYAARDSWERGLKRVLAACERLASADGYVRAADIAASVRAKELGQWIDALVAEGALARSVTRARNGREAVRYRITK